MIYRSLKDLYADRDGATSIEYALIGSLIAVAIVGCLALLGPELQGAFQRTVDLFPG